MTSALPRRLAYVPLGQITPAVRNPKNHDLQALTESISRFGFGEVPMVDERTGRLVAGHGRDEALVALRQQGRPAPDGIVVDDDGEWLVPVLRGWSSLNDGEAEAYLVGSNRLPESGGWFYQGLAEMLDDIHAQDATLLDAVGFDADDIDALLRRTDGDGTAGHPDGEGGGVDDLPGVDGEDRAELVQCPACGQTFPLRV